MTPELSIVIPAYNEAHSIGACLRSVARQDIDQSYEVVLVDNHCTDETVAVAQAAVADLDLRIVHEWRHGRGAARRVGFEAARGRILFSADADAVYPRDWLRTLLTALDKPGIVAASTSARIADLSGWRNLTFNVAQPLAMYSYRLVFGHHCLSGFSFAISRSVYEASGGFDPLLNADEDADLSRRVARLGRIRLLLKPVTMSGRRFRHGLIPGLFAYVRMTLEYRLSRGDTQLTDIR
ncbi:MAG TPA: glycosyltransferase [Chloroflexota bacterium]|jgi:glycosyltransferase involved in cell wall biosynthesis